MEKKRKKQGRNSCTYVHKRKRERRVENDDREKGGRRRWRGRERGGAVNNEDEEERERGQKKFSPILPCLRKQEIEGEREFFLNPFKFYIFINSFAQCFLLLKIP